MREVLVLEQQFEIIDKIIKKKYWNYSRIWE